jgi:hypothetical protein
MAIKTKIQVRRDTEANWAGKTLADGEIGYTNSGTNKGMFKIGDGETVWGSLSYQNQVGPKGDKGDAGDTGTTGATGPGYAGVTSTSSIGISTGSKTFLTTNTGAYIAGNRVLIVNTGTPTNFLSGDITAVVANTSITVLVDGIGGTGTFTAWTFTLTGLKGDKGDAGNDGADGSNGAAGADGKGYDGITSTSSVTIGTGSKSFTVNKVGALVVGTFIRAANPTTTTNFVEGTITAISGTDLTVNVVNTGGSGTVTSWNISVAGIKGSEGASGLAARYVDSSDVLIANRNVTVKAGSTGPTSPNVGDVWISF